MYIQQKAIVFDSAGNMQLANLGQLNLVQETGDIETVIVLIALQVINIKDQPAAGSIDSDGPGCLDSFRGGIS